jgi:uncharacterized protein (TIGR02118 family)
MILRSGLIQNRDGVSQDAFGEHWLGVHGPLARKVPFLRGYRQNHIIERLPTPDHAALHRIDGVSELSFDDVPTMVRAMDSPEQQACIDDIKGFLSAVTLMIMQPEQVLDGPEHAGDAKLMTVLFGDPAAHASHVGEMKRRAKAAFLQRAAPSPFPLPPPRDAQLCDRPRAYCRFECRRRRAVRGSAQRILVSDGGRAPRSGERRPD